MRYLVLALALLISLPTMEAAVHEAKVVKVKVKKNRVNGRKGAKHRVHNHNHAN